MSNGVTSQPSIEELTQLLQRTDPNNIPGERQWRTVERCVMLAPTLEICQALLRGERVPLSRLNQRAVRRYGIRRAA